MSVRASIGDPGGLLVEEPDTEDGQAEIGAGVWTWRRKELGGYQTWN